MKKIRGKFLRNLSIFGEILFCARDFWLDLELFVESENWERERIVEFARNYGAKFRKN